MKPDANPGGENLEHGTDPALEKTGIEMENAGLSQNGEAPPGPTSTPEPAGWEELQWSLFGLGPDGDKLPSEEKIPYEEVWGGDLSEDLSSLVGELDKGTRRVLKKIDAYASASALAQERAALMGRADDLTMDLRDMQEQIREMEAAAAGLRSAVQEAYRRPEEALRVWDRLVGERGSAGSPGFGKVSQILVASPERLGTLRGTSAFGFSTPARFKAVQATARAAGFARAYQDAARRATRLGVFGKDQAPGRDSETKGHRSGEKETGRYPGLFQKREEIEATRKEASALAEKVKEFTGGQSLSEQGRAVTERVRSLDPEQRQALRRVILGAGEQSIGREQAGRGMASRATPRAVPGRDALEKKPVARRNATARSTTSRGQPASKATSKASAMKGLLKASLRHVAIHVAIRTLDRVEKEARGREMLEI
jgi:hypothetical protein